MKERWKLIEDYPNYEVSNIGNVRNRVTGRVLKSDRHKNGYLMVGLRKDRKMKRFSVHRLVASAFIENPENKRTVNHLDGCKSNNYVSNLEWSTDSENIRHSYRTGLRFHSDRAGRPKQKVRCIETEQEFESICETARYFDCNPGSIHVSIHKGCCVQNQYHFELV